MTDAQGARIRLLFAGTTFVVGGAERILYHLIKGLDRAPFSVELLSLREPGSVGEEIRDLGVPVHSNLTGSGRLDPLLPLKLHRFLRRGRYDAIYFLDHAHAVFYGTIASWGTSVRARFMPVHTTGQWNGQPSLRRPIRMVRPQLDRIISIAEAQRRYLIQEEGVPEEQLVVIPNGVPIEAPTPEERAGRRREVRLELDASDDVPVIGITAVLRPEKNHEMLLRSLVRVRRHVPAELWVVGDGPRRAALESLAESLGLLPAVRFLGHRSDARRIMSGFDVAVLASHPRVETLPLSLIEAMDAGNPVVATSVGALPEMVEHGSSGYIVPVSDEEAMADALVRILTSREAGEAMGRRGQAIAGQSYSVDKMVGLTEALLLERLSHSS